MTALVKNVSDRRRKAPLSASPAPQILTVGQATLDVLERLLLFVFYFWFLWNLLSAFRQDPRNWICGLLIVSESVTVFFLLVRRNSRSISARPGDWGLSLAATLVPLLACPGGEAPLASVTAGQILLALGTVAVLYAKFTLGRSLGMIPAHRGLKLSGLYRLVRHPMYACYVLCHLGVLLRYPTAWNLAVYVVFYSLQVPRLLAEESHLESDPNYRQYMSEVPHRLIPGIF